MITSVLYSRIRVLRNGNVVIEKMAISVGHLPKEPKSTINLFNNKKAKVKSTINMLNKTH